jgi:hypothetical protein
LATVRQVNDARDPPDPPIEKLGQFSANANPPVSVQTRGKSGEKLTSEKRQKCRFFLDK